ncbi:MAG TPA: 3-phosphoshikimate 1-carboxyvinyltransferase, partial [Microthrixaceae bacterium]|nr:3-phosphoshikimate 1-carboxyvinyltransferase [Microthrixaceae bacterium]
FLASAALTRGRIRVEGLGRRSSQGDIRFVDVLEQMGAQVTWEDHAVELVGPEQLAGVEVDMSDISDVAQTLAIVATAATSPTRVTGIGFIRKKETDRIRAVVTELNRLGIDAVEEPDGFTVHPGRVKPATVQTYDDHRMAMSFALLGLVSPGVEIADPHCVAKTYPSFWQDLEAVRTTGE